MPVKLNVFYFFLILTLIGKSFSLNCTSIFCKKDLERLTSAASDNKTVKPCDDFKTFAMGRFLNQYVSYNDVAVGFQIDVIKSYKEKQKNIFKKLTTSNECSVVRLMKRFYETCNKVTGHRNFYFNLDRL